MITLYNDDCFNIFPKLENKSIDLVLCDMPYGTTACKWDTVLDLAKMWEEVKRINKGAFVLFASQPFTTTLICSQIKLFKYLWVWEKTKASGFLNARRRPLTAHEDICVFGCMSCYNPQGLLEINVNNARKNKSGNGCFGKVSDKPYINKEGNFPRSVIKFQHETNPVHPTQKPVALMEYLIKTYSNEGDTVLDFCMGSGTTGVAAKILNRNFIGIELLKEYYDIAERRIFHE